MPKRNPNAPLLDHAADMVRQRLAPLAERMRPRTLVEFVGQAHVLAPGRLLRRAIEADQLSSVIFSGPPGSGKTTLARIIAQTTRSDFLSINAVLAGISDIRQCVEQAQEAWRTRQIRTHHVGAHKFSCRATSPGTLQIHLLHLQISSDSIFKLYTQHLSVS